MTEKNPIQSAGRIFTVMELLAERGPMRIVEISKTLDLNKSTVHRLLASLISMGYARQDETTELYSLTFKLAKLAEDIIGRTDSVELAHPFLKELSEKCGETVHMVQREGSHIVYIDKVESYTASSIRMVSRVGLSYPVFHTAVGKAMLSYDSEEKIKALWDTCTHEKITEYTITEYQTFLDELALTRQRGYALDNEENEIGVRCIGSVILNYKGKCENAFSISAPIARMSDDRIEQLAELVLEYQKKISEAFGYIAE